MMGAATASARWWGGGVRRVGGGNTSLNYCLHACHWRLNKQRLVASMRISRVFYSLITRPLPWEWGRSSEDKFLLIAMMYIVHCCTVPWKKCHACSRHVTSIFRHVYLVLAWNMHVSCMFHAQCTTCIWPLCMFLATMHVTFTNM